MQKKRIFSGIQPTGSIHIGNYLGAIRHWVALQGEFENIFCIVDLHAISIPQTPETLKSKTREIAAQINGTPVLALRPKEACKALGIGERLLWSLTNQGVIPHVKLGRAVVYPIAALNSWLAEQANAGMQ